MDGLAKGFDHHVIIVYKRGKKNESLSDTGTSNFKLSHVRLKKHLIT